MRWWRRERQPGPPPAPWPAEAARPRVLVEAVDPTEGWALTRILRRAGYQSAVCAGPRLRGGDCPLFEGKPCPLVEGADGILHALSPFDPQDVSVLRAHRHAHPEVPIAVQVPDLYAERIADLLEGVPRFPASAVRREILTAVRRMLDGARAPGSNGSKEVRT